MPTMDIKGKFSLTLKGLPGLIKANGDLPDPLRDEDLDPPEYVHCGCDQHGDHAGCTSECERDGSGCDPEASNVEAYSCGSNYCDDLACTFDHPEAL